MSGRILVGVSACLLGEKVRWDGRHKHDRFLTDILSRHCELVPVCPEIEVGMGVPREPIHLQGDPAAPHLIGNTSGRNWTARMNRYACRKLTELAARGLSGFVLKQGSPSCGLARVPVATGAAGRPRRTGTGLFAAALQRRLPRLPVVQEEQLQEPALRENFIVCLFAHDRVRQLFAGRVRRGEIVAFHAREKYLLMAHSPSHLRKLGQLVAQVKDLPLAALRERYEQDFLDALQTPATVSRHVNVLLHLLGYLRGSLAPAAKQDILETIAQYRAGLVPLLAPLTLLSHYCKLQGLDYLLEQSYLQPAPAELALRNHV